MKQGELIVVEGEGIRSRFYAPAQPMKACVFEQVYFSRPDSVVFGRSVATSRELMGRDRNHPATTVVGWAVGVLVTLLNALLIWLTLAA